MNHEDKIVAAIERKIKTGDVVLHRPSGERWLVAYAENGYVCACGWPETLAKESDCELVDSASEENRIRLLHEIANKQGNDTRRSYARRVLGLSAALVLCLIQVAAAPLVSDGDEIASMGVYGCSTDGLICIGPDESRRIDCHHCGCTFRQWAEGKEPKR